MSTVNSSTMSYLSTAYGRTASQETSSASQKTATSGPASASSAATVVTLSAEAQALLSGQGGGIPLANVVADTRTALDDLYNKAGVSGPFEGGKLAVDLGGLDRRALFAIVSGVEQTFSTDEQQAARSELQNRFDAMLSPQAAVARLTDDWSKVYKAAIDYLQDAGPEEKATARWGGTLQALQQGYDDSLKQKGAVPKGITGDPVAEFLAHTDDGSSAAGLRDFELVAKDVRTALDQQYAAADAKGKRLVFERASGNVQLADLSGLNNRALSAMSLNQGDQFSRDEMRAAKQELDARTRASLLAALKQGGDSGDPREFSAGLVYQYSAMSAEERQAMNWTSDIQDIAIKNYRMSSSLLSMFEQATGGGSLFDYIN
jgi:hypothetical protein